MEPARNINELIVWQLASRLGALIDELLQQPKAHRNRKFREQIRESSASVASNLAEGFGRYYPRENAYFVRIAKGSLQETQNHLLVGKRRGYWTPKDFERAWRLSCRTMKAIVPYLVYLEGCDGELPGPKSEEPTSE